jgi:hypothetical protein
MGEIPEPPTAFELEQAYANLDNFKMISDELIFQPANFNLLFGPGSLPQTAANFKVVRALQTDVTDNQIRNDVITAINNFFDVTQNRFDFGEVVYMQECLAYVQQQMATVISSIVIVPTYGPSVFGDLFQIRSGTNQLPLSTATVANVQIVNALTGAVMRTTGGL